MADAGHGVGAGAGRIRQLHRWEVTPAEAATLQQELRARAAVVVLSWPALEPLDQAWAEVPAAFPYIPGYLSFREGPAVLAAFERLTLWPDLVIFDGQGTAHPRRLGLACHLGLFLDLPSIGCAKSRLCGTHDPPGPARGDWAPLYDEGEVIGAALRSRPGTRPLYVSPGHRVDLPTAIGRVLDCCAGYRLPETTRRAHRLAGEGGVGTFG